MELEIKNVSKQYSKQFWGLRDFSLKIGKGVLGLLGPNGAGKSTLMTILATVTQPTQGQVSWNGIDISKQPDELRRTLGYLPQDFGVYPHLNALEFLDYMAAVKGLEANYARRRVKSLLDLVNLGEARYRQLGGYSGGMRQRVGIAQALLNDPQLLIVDEPTAGLDPQERIHFRNLLSDLSDERIVILSTHIVPDIEATATDIALIRSGSLIRHALPEEFLKDVAGMVYEMVIPGTQLSEIKNKMIVSNTTHRQDGVHVRVISPDRPEVKALSVEPCLEDAYLYYIADQIQREAA